MRKKKLRSVRCRMAPDAIGGRKRDQIVYRDLEKRNKLIGHKVRYEVYDGLREPVELVVRMVQNHINNQVFGFNNNLEWSMEKTRIIIRGESRIMQFE